jgi:hypothetical protein
MTRALVAFSALVLAGCMAPPAETQNTSETGDEIVFVEEYGFCARSCYSELRVGEAGDARVIVRERRDGATISDRTVKLSAEETQQLMALVAAAAEAPWEAQYGCPDCADQGRYELAFAARRTVLDPASMPDTFDDAVTALRAVLHRERQP